MSTDHDPPPHGEFLLYTTEDGRTRVECRFADETLWLSQALMAELFDRDVRTINEHLQNLYEEEELMPEATIRKFRIVRQEGQRQVGRLIEHYNLEAILAVGFRIKSPRGTQFRKWANTRLQEYLVKGFTNFLTQAEIEELNRIVVMWLDYAEDQTRRRQQIFLRDWQTKLEEFLRFNDRAVLPHAGSISKKEADAHAGTEYESFQERRRQLPEAEAQRDDVKQLEDVDKSADKADSNEAE